MTSSWSQSEGSAEARRAFRNCSKIGNITIATRITKTAARLSRAESLLRASPLLGEAPRD
ncbi:hypothetical protein ACIA58_23265 [Kribbella sp. NPDC051586]|uniref:hypothetical protein n=1 Tax=Kribbella sp. NPDC051586 TaxID=3364118 RepID=UPI0037933489